MATLTRNITKGTNPMGIAEILLRLSVSRNLVVRLTTKNPYVFNFLTMTEDHNEREL